LAQFERRIDERSAVHVERYARTPIGFEPGAGDIDIAAADRQAGKA